MKREIHKLMLDGKTLRCCYDLVRVDTRWPDFRQCTRKATCTRKGGMYCQQHDPIEKQRKLDEKSKTWDRKFAAENRRHEIQALFPKLVAALDCYKLSPEHQKLYEKAKALIE